MTSAERFEHMVAMALEAWDETFPNRERYLASGYLALERRRFESAVRERLAQSAQVYELEIGASERSGCVVSSPGHEWTKHEREGWSVCSHCGMVRNYDRETTTCSGALPKIRQRSEIEDCGQDGVCKLSPGCNRHWEERNRELLRENEVLRSNSDHLSSENASLARQVESMAMRIESLAEELAKPEDVRLREVLDALDGRAVIFDGLGVRVTHLLDEMDEWIARAGAAERRLKKAEEVVMLARQLTAYSWEDRLEDCEVSDAAKHDSRELSTAIWFYDQEEKS